MATHPRFSVLSSASSTDSPTTSSTRFSVPSVSTTPKPPGARSNIYDRPLNRTRTTEVSASAFAFLFSEVVQYTQKRVNGIADLERRYLNRAFTVHQLTENISSASRLNTLGYRVGTRVLELLVWRSESISKAPKREIRFLPALMSIHTQVWRAVFGKPADALEKSVENADECEWSPFEAYIKKMFTQTQI
jgi:trafficking protein particle complex subunit 5